MFDKWLDQFTEILGQIAPLMSRNVKNSYAPFNDEKLRHKMLLCDLHKKDNGLRDPSDWLKYKQLRNEVALELKAKRNSYFS